MQIEELLQGVERSDGLYASNIFECLGFKQNMGPLIRLGGAEMGEELFFFPTIFTLAEVFFALESEAPRHFQVEKGPPVGVPFMSLAGAEVKDESSTLPHGSSWILNADLLTSCPALQPLGPPCYF